MIKKLLLDILKTVCAIVGFIAIFLMFLYAAWLAISEAIPPDPSNPQTSIGIDTIKGIKRNAP